MGGELETTTLNKNVHEKKDSKDLGKTSSRNHKNKHQSIATDENGMSKKHGSKSAIKTTNNNNELKRGAAKKRRRKFQYFLKIKKIKIRKKRYWN